MASYADVDVINAAKQLAWTVLARSVCKQLAEIKWNGSLGEQFSYHTATYNHQLIP